jgi:DNA-binding NarL/FixJ family response regulator
MTDANTDTVRPSADGTEPIRVFVIDDHPAFLRTVASVIDATPGFTLVGTAETGARALDALAGRSDVDMVLLDVNLPDLSGIEVARRRAADGATELIILMSTADPADLPADAFERGVAGFLPKELLTTRELREVWDDAHDVS